MHGCEWQQQQPGHSILDNVRMSVSMDMRLRLFNGVAALMTVVLCIRYALRDAMRAS